MRRSLFSLESWDSSFLSLLLNCVVDIRSVQWERDLSSYVWTESVFDTPNSVNKLLCDSGTLMMKARGYTPAVHRYIPLTFSHLRFAVNITQLLRAVNRTLLYIGS